VAPRPPPEPVTIGFAFRGSIGTGSATTGSGTPGSVAIGSGRDPLRRLGP